MNRCRIIRLSLAVALSAAALLGCLLGCPGGAWAETLTRVAAFDVNYSTSPTNPSPTQAGFAGLHDGANVNSPPAFSTTQNGVTLTLSTILSDRDRLANGALVGHPRADMLRDFAFSNVTSGSPSTFMTAAFSGLKPNADYFVKVHSYDEDANNRTLSLWYDGRATSDSWSAPGFLGTHQVLQANPSTAVFTTTVTTDSQGQMLLRARGSTSWGSMTLLNGIELFERSGLEDVIRVDMNNSTSNTGPVNATEPGYVGLALAAGSTTGSVTHNGVTVTVTTDQASLPTRHRNNTGEDLYADYVYAQSKLDVTIDGLEAGKEYLFTVYSLDTSGNGGAASQWRLNDPDGLDDDSIIRTTQWNTGNASALDAGSFSFLLTPESSSITLTARDPYNYAAGSTYDKLLFFNGLDIQTVPEPATLALLALAAGGIGGYVRRRKAA